jgi:hypothetical protein
MVAAIVDVPEHAMQATCGDRVVDHIVGHPQEAHLLAGDDALLPRRQSPKPLLVLSGAPFP